MSFYTTALRTRNRASAANRLPDHHSLMLAAGVIQRRYNTSPGMALVVAELIGASSGEARR
jgi:hypothetical protein